MAARALDRSATAPLWDQLRREVRRRLDDGEFADRFPGELALVAEYGVSRHTVRQALRELRASGAVVAERGRHPRVAEPTEIEQPIGAIYSLFASVEAAGLPQRSEVRRLDIRADGVVAPRLAEEGSAPLLYLERIRYAGAEPLAVDRVWLPASVAGPLVDADFRHTSLYTELARRTGLRLDSGQETIHAVTPTSVERSMLAAPAGAAAFAINRLSSARGRPVEWRHTLVRGDRFALTATFTASGYQLMNASGGESQGRET